MTLVVQDKFGILHIAYIIYPIQGESVAVALCQSHRWTYSMLISTGETDCMACIAREVA